jgi:hypothetical protein
LPFSTPIAIILLHPSRHTLRDSAKGSVAPYTRDVSVGEKDESFFIYALNQNPHVLCYTAYLLAVLSLHILPLFNLALQYSNPHVVCPLSNVEALAEVAVTFFVNLQELFFVPFESR